MNTSPTFLPVGTLSPAYSSTNATINNTSSPVQQPFYSIGEKILIFLSGSLLSLFTIAGNVLVVVAYRKNKRLQTVTNLFIFSLSISDITVGVFSINFYTIYIVMKSWPFGTVMCNIWLCLDYSCCQASVIHLLVICLDRYFSIMRPLKYRVKRTERIAKIAIVLAWVLAFFQWAPWIVSYPYMVGERTVPYDDCYVQFIYENTFAAIITACAAYYAPVLIMGLVYLRIYFLVKSRESELQNMSPNEMSAMSKKRQKEKQSKTSESSGFQLNGYRGKQSQPELHMSKYKKFHLSKIALLMKQKKTAKLLSTIFLAFTITWLPYHIFAVWAPFCPDCIPTIGWEFSYMLCYLNSTVNPFCYALGSKDFRTAFKKLLCRKFNSASKSINTNPVLRKNIYLVSPNPVAGEDNEGYEHGENSNGSHEDDSSVKD